jgi:hypothetical protein
VATVPTPYDTADHRDATAEIPDQCRGTVEGTWVVTADGHDRLESRPLAGSDL